MAIDREPTLQDVLVELRRLRAVAADKALAANLTVKPHASFRVRCIEAAINLLKSLESDHK